MAPEHKGNGAQVLPALAGARSRARHGAWSPVGGMMHAHLATWQGLRLRPGSDRSVVQPAQWAPVTAVTEGTLPEQR